MEEFESGRLFIVGVGRSGTSLLQSMLNAHPCICFPPETNFIRRFLATRVLEKMWARDKDLVARILVSDELIARLGIAEETIRAILSSFADGFSSQKLYVELLSVYATAAGKENAHWIGDKDPRSVEYLPLLSRRFPQARVLHVIRDPRDVLASKKKASWSKGRPSPQHVFANRVQLKMGRQLGPRHFGKRYLEFAYEELLEDTTTVLTRISDFLDIEFDSAMLEFSNSGRQLVSEQEMQWKKETLGPLLVQNSGKWKDELTSWEVALTERACGEAFRAMGYQKSAETIELNIAQRLSLPLVGLLSVSLDPLYRLYRKACTAK